MNFLKRWASNLFKKEAQKITQQVIREKLDLQPRQEYLFNLVTNPEINKPLGLTTETAINIIEQAVNNKYEAIYVKPEDIELQGKLIAYGEKIGVTLPPIVNTINLSNKGKYLIALDK